MSDIKRTVWKYVWPFPSNKMMLELPQGSQPLHVHNQGKQLCLWICVAVGNPTLEVRHFELCGTGHPAPAAEFSKYIGSAHMGSPRGEFVWHIFEVIA